MSGGFNDKVWGFIPLGAHSSGDDISSATTLTPESGATKLMIQATDQNIRVTLDGSTPTASNGFQITVGNAPTIIPISDGVTIKVIEEAATAAIQYQWGV